MSETSQFFADKTMFVTGATGFLGKVLIERILWHLPRIRRIFLLTRPHSARNTEVAAAIRAERAIFGSPIFNRLRSRYGERFEALVREKVKIVAGDLSVSGLGLSPGCLKEIGSEMDFVINVAASVAFDAPLDQSVRLNTLGPLHLLNFAKQFSHPTFLHVSTAYVTGQRSEWVREEILQPDVSPLDLMGSSHNERFGTDFEIERALRLAESVESESRTRAATREFRHAARRQFNPDRMLDDGALDAAAEKNRQRWVRDVLSRDGRSRARQFGWFDSYTFTKAMGEQLLAKCSGGIPVIIVRPTIIESSLDQPEPGWLEGYRTSTPILLGYGKGEIPDFPGHRDSIIDFVPVDFVANALLATLTTAARSNRPRVFQIASSSENPLGWSELIEYCREYFQHLPLQTGSHPIIPKPWKHRSREEFDTWIRWRQSLLHIGLSLCHPVRFWPVAERLGLQLARQQTHFKRLQSYSRTYGDYVRLFCRFANDNTRLLAQSLPKEDQQQFFFDPKAIAWRKYIQEVHLPAIRRHCVKSMGHHFCAIGEPRQLSLLLD